MSELNGLKELRALNESNAFSNGLGARIDRAWRLIATGAAFTAFGVCGVLFSVFVFPFAWLWPHRASSQRVVTAIIHVFFRALLALLDTLGVMRLEVSGGEALAARGPAVVVANHPTYLDVVVLLALVPRACCVVKNAHWGNPCFWGIVRAARYISNADPSELVEAGARQLAAGYTIIVFPEGTRSRPGQPLTMQRGAARIALAAGTEVLPVTITCEPRMLGKGEHWYRVPPRPGHWRMVVGEPMHAADYAPAGVPEPLAARRLTRHFVEYFTRSVTAVTPAAAGGGSALVPGGTMYRGVDA